MKAWKYVANFVVDVFCTFTLESGITWNPFQVVNALGVVTKAPDAALLGVQTTILSVLRCQLRDNNLTWYHCPLMHLSSSLHLSALSVVTVYWLEIIFL